VAIEGGASAQFPVDEFSKTCLLEGVDELGFLMKQEAAIAAFEARRAFSLNTLA
jgi:3-isopropylmalate/(R)-2-methylmalate dehydratase small subunit